MSKEYNCFKALYIKRHMLKHYGNPFCDTEEKTIENLGGDDAIAGLYSCWTLCNEEAQRRVVGFSLSDVKQHLEEAGL